jgi:hypothetical protein
MISTLDPFERNKVPKWFGRGQQFIKEEYFHETFVTAHCRFMIMVFNTTLAIFQLYHSGAAHCKIYLSLKKKYFVVFFFGEGVCYHNICIFLMKTWSYSGV